MYEKVNPKHPDKVADRIAGAIVDLAYAESKNPKIACEVLIGHGKCHIIAETSERLNNKDVCKIVKRIAGKDIVVDFVRVSQDKHLAKNQSKEIRCGDNGIFKGVPITSEQKELTEIAKDIYKKYPYDGKYILNKKDNKLIICQSNANNDLFELLRKKGKSATVNPLGDWTGGINVDTGATNRKLGSDMGDAVTGGGLHGKDLSKADVSVNVVCHIFAQKLGKTVKAYCAIGDEYVQFSGGYNKKMPYADVVRLAKAYIKSIGGFEKLAEWGLIK